MWVLVSRPLSAECLFLRKCHTELPCWCCCWKQQVWMEIRRVQVWLRLLTGMDYFLQLSPLHIMCILEECEEIMIVLVSQFGRGSAKKTKKAEPKKKTKDADMPKRPPSAYFIFMYDCQIQPPVLHHCFIALKYLLWITFSISGIVTRGRGLWILYKL